MSKSLKNALRASLLGVVMLFAQNVFANWTLTTKAGCITNGKFLEGYYVAGAGTKGAMQIYISTDENVLNALTFKYGKNKNLTITEDTVTWNTSGFPDEADLSFEEPGTFSLSMDTRQKTLVAANTTNLLIATVTYDVADVDADLNFAAPEVKAAYVTSGQKYVDLTDVVGPNEVTVPETFNFKVVAGTWQTIDEDPDEALILDATNKSQFSCQIWDSTQMAAIDSDKVEFTRASVDGRADEAVVKVVDGEIRFMPNRDKNGTFVIAYAAASTDPAVEGVKEGTVEITVTPVYDAPVVEVSDSDLQFTEGKAYNDAANSTKLVIKVTENVDNVELDNAATFAYGDISLGVKLVESTTEEDVFTVNFDGIDGLLPFEAVKHPASESIVDFTLTITPKADDADAIDVAVSGVKLIDTDQSVVINPELFDAVFVGGAQTGDVSNGYTVTADTQISFPECASDADGDKIYYSNTLPEELKKRDKFVGTLYATTTPYNTSLKATDEASIEFTVVNSEPVAKETSYSKFLQMKDGEEGTWELTLEATDADAGDVLQAKCTQNPDSTAWKVSIDGLKVTFTTTSTVELLGQEFKFVVEDDESKSEEITVTIDYRKDPPPVFGNFSFENKSAKEAEEDETKYLVVTTSVHDDDSYEGVAPSGIKSVQWTLLDKDGVAIVNPAEPEEAIYTMDVEYSEDGETWKNFLSEVDIQGADKLYTRCTFTFTQDFVEHPATDRAVNVKVDAQDGVGAESSVATTAEDGLMVEDVDRAPSATDEYDTTVSEILDRDGEVAIMMTDTGDLDEDGDAVKFVYKWYYLEDYEGAEWTEFTEEMYDNVVVDGEGYQTYTEKGEDFHTAMKQGTQVKVEAYTTTDPYQTKEEEDFVQSEEPCVAEAWTIEDTVPYFIDETGTALEAPAFTAEIPEDLEEPYTLAIYVMDPDTIDGADLLEFSLAEDLDETVGKIEFVDAECLVSPLGGVKVTFQFAPAANYYNDGKDAPCVTIVATDDSGNKAQEECTVTLVVGRVNDKPIVIAADQFVLPSDAEDVDPQVAIFEVNMGDDFETAAVEEENEEDGDTRASEEDPEAEQTVIDAKIIAWDEDAEGCIFAEEPTCEVVDGTHVKVSYVLKEDIKLGMSSKITLTVQDDGQSFDLESKELYADPQWSEETTFIVYVDATPWYPIIQFACPLDEVDDAEAHDGHTLHLEATDNSVYDLTVKGEGRLLKPVDYYNASVAGYVDNVEISYKAYEWSMENGTTEELCAEANLVPRKYCLPWNAEVVEEVAASEEEETPEEEGITELTADEKGFVTLPTIEIKLAKSYVIQIAAVESEEETEGETEEEGEPEYIQTIKADFAPNAEGYILPTIEGLKVQIAEVGEYAVFAKGINPNGEGETVAVAKIIVEAESEPALEWNDEEVLPAEGSVQTTDQIKLAWAAATNADAYVVRIYDADGNEVLVSDKLDTTSYDAKLVAEAEAKSYIWNVTAIRYNEDGSVAEELVSEYHTFTLAKTSSEVVITAITVKDGNALYITFDGDPAADVYDCLYYDVESNSWFDNSSLTLKTDADGNYYLQLSDGTPVAAGDYVLLYKNGNAETRDFFVVMP